MKQKNTIDKQVNKEFENGMEYLLRLKNFKGFDLRINNQIKAFRVSRKHHQIKIIEYNARFVYKISKEFILYKLVHLVKMHKTDNIARADMYAWTWCEIRGFDMNLISEYLFAKHDRPTEIRYRFNLIFRRIMFSPKTRNKKLRQKAYNTKISILKAYHGNRNK